MALETVFAEEADGVPCESAEVTAPIELGAVGRVVGSQREMMFWRLHGNCLAHGEQKRSDKAGEDQDGVHGRRGGQIQFYKKQIRFLIVLVGSVVFGLDAAAVALAVLCIITLFGAEMKVATLLLRCHDCKLFFAVVACREDLDGVEVPVVEAVSDEQCVLFARVCVCQLRGGHDGPRE